MSVARTWLLTVAVACSSPAGDTPKVQESGSAPAPATADAAVAKPVTIDPRYDAGALGALTFAHSEGTPEARALFARGLLALHSFWYDEAARQFQAALDADRTMNMAYWGVAMSRLKLLWGEDDLTAAKKVLSKMPDPDRLTPREQAWVIAAVELVRAPDVRTSRKKFAEAIATLHAQFPDDESATFLAVALLATTRPEDPDTVAVRKRAAALALEVWNRNPKHPGAAHYLIHAYDTPELAALALPYAREYAKIAPAAFHARHMPAHIFSRLGMWKDALASCQSAWDASVAAAQRDKLSANHHDFHSLTWLIEMSFEVGRRKDADAALAVYVAAVRGGLGRQHRAQYATEVASYMMRTGEWARVDDTLLAPLEAPVAEDAEIIAGRAGAPSTHCAPVAASSPLELVEQLAVLEARVRAAAMLRDPVATKRHLTAIDALREKLRPHLLTTQPTEMVARMDAADARRRDALLARATGNDRALLDNLRKSAANAAEAPLGESNPSGFVLHEEIAETLLRLAQPKAAAVEYVQALRKHPGRARSLLGATRAAARSGDSKGAREAYEQLLGVWSAADPERLAEALAALESR